jgi:hypothetical protein
MVFMLLNPGLLSTGSRYLQGFIKHSNTPFDFKYLLKTFSFRQSPFFKITMANIWGSAFDVSTFNFFNPSFLRLLSQ